MYHFNQETDWLRIGKYTNGAGEKDFKVRRPSLGFLKRFAKMLHQELDELFRRPHFKRLLSYPFQ